MLFFQLFKNLKGVLHIEHKSNKNNHLLLQKKTPLRSTFLVQNLVFTTLYLNQ